MRKELEISAKFDTSDFDKAVERMQKRLKEIYAPADMVRAQTATNARLQGMGMSPGGPYSAAMGSSSSYRSASVQEKRELEQTIQKQVQSQERLAKLILQRDELMKRLEDRQKRMADGSREELKIKEQINRMEENQLRLKENYRQRDAALNQMLDAREKSRNNLRTGFSGEGFDLMRRFASQGMYGAASRQFGRMATANPMDTMGMGGVGLIAGAGLAGRGVQLGETLAGAPQRLEEARGNAVGNTVGRDLQAAYSGRSPFEAAWMPERKAAAGTAKEKADWQKTFDKIKIGIAGALVIGGIAAAVAATGGAALPGAVALGSALGVSATTVGVIGGATVAGGAATAALANDQTRNKMLSVVPGQYGREHGEQYQQLIASQQAQDFRAVLENLKEQDPKKRLALENYERDRMRDLGAQRSLGLSDFGYYGGGGFLNMAHRGGFMNEQAINMAQGIIGAGGSARMGRQATFGLGMERGGLTNAGGILGSLSGSIQSPDATKRATIGIMAEAFQIGLDNTDFAEENRRFTQAAAQIIGRSGVTGEVDQDRIARTLGMFLGERTNRGVEAAGNAYERFQQRGSQLGGRRGAQRLSEASKDPILSKFSTQDLVELLGARPDQLRPDSAFLQSYAAEAKTTPEKLLESMGKVNAKSRFLIPGRNQEVGKLSENVNKYMQEQGMTYQQLVEASRAGKLPENIARDFGMIQRRISQEESGGYETSNIEAQAGEFLQGTAPPSPTQKKRAEDVVGDLGERLGDEFNKKAAEGEDEARKNLRQMTDELKEAAAAADMFTQAASGAARSLHGEQQQRVRTDMTQGNPMGSDIWSTIMNSNSTEQRTSVQPQSSGVEK